MSDSDLFKMRVHPAAAAFPLESEAKLQQLAEDIRLNGQIYPIVLIDGGGEWLILDGRNRLKACQVAGVTPKDTVYSGKDPVGFVVSVNLRRRDLDESARAMVAAKLATLKHGGDRSKVPIGLLTESRTVAESAALMNVGARSVKRARQVLDHGSEDLIAAVDRGEVKVGAAAVVAMLPKEEQSRIVSEGRVREAAAAVRAAVEATEDEGAELLEPDPEDEAWPWDETLAVGRLTDVITQTIREWEGSSFRSLATTFRMFLNQVEKIDAKRQAT